MVRSGGVRGTVLRGMDRRHGHAGRREPPHHTTPAAAPRRGDLHLLPLTDVRHPVPQADPATGRPNVAVIGGNMCRWPLAGKDAHPMRYVRTTVAPPRQP